MRLLDLGFFRVGSDRYTEFNNTYGLTTLLREHTRCRGGEVLFTYPAKHGKEQVKAVVDPATGRAVTSLMRRRREGQRLLAYWERRAWHEVTGDGVNTYLKELGGVEVTAMDFRTWHTTVMPAVAWRSRNGSPAARRAPPGHRPRRTRGRGLPRQHPGGVPLLVHQPAGHRALRGGGHGGRRVAPARRRGDGRHAGDAGGRQGAVLRMLRTGRSPAPEAAALGGTAAKA